MTNPQSKKFLQRSSLADSLARIQEEKIKKQIFPTGALLQPKEATGLSYYREECSIHQLDISKSTHMFYQQFSGQGNRLHKVITKDQPVLYLGYRPWAWDFHYIHFFLWQSTILFKITKELSLRQFSLAKMKSSSNSRANKIFAAPTL